MSPSPFGSFHKLPPNKKCPCSPIGNKDRKYISAVPPCLPETRPLCNGANTPSAFNAGNTSADTQGRSLFPLPSAAHLLLRFSLRSQLCETLCGCAAQLYFRFYGLLMVTLFNYTFVRLSRTFFRVWWKRLLFASAHDRISTRNGKDRWVYGPWDESGRVVSGGL